jgi:hypothetical protein
MDKSTARVSYHRTVRLLIIFKEIEEGFKNSGNGKTVDSDEKIFNRASKEMREWVIVFQSVEV